MRKLLLFTLALLPLPCLALADCLDDYHLNQSWQPHHLSARSLALAAGFAAAGDPAHGWHYLAGLGDPYAALAANVVDPNAHSILVLAHRFVRQHWVNVVGEKTTSANFTAFAQQHYRQYVEILQTGTWPDADQILNSYLTAARSHGLPEAVVFDAAWTASDASRFVSWQVLNELPRGRQIERSQICLKTSREAANALLERDFLGRALISAPIGY
jgi:hypothetical protein